MIRKIAVVAVLLFLAVIVMSVFNYYGKPPVLDARQSAESTEQTKPRISETSPQDREKSSRHDSREQSSMFTLSMSWMIYFFYYVIGIVVAVLIVRDARTRGVLAMNIAPIWWGLIAVVEPALGLLAYWVIHYSKISPLSADSNRIV